MDAWSARASGNCFSCSLQLVMIAPGSQHMSTTSKVRTLFRPSLAPSLDKKRLHVLFAVEGDKRWYQSVWAQMGSVVGSASGEVVTNLSFLTCGGMIPDTSGSVCDRSLSLVPSTSQTWP
jgi:hypothetical protein